MCRLFFWSKLDEVIILKSNNDTLNEEKQHITVLLSSNNVRLNIVLFKAH